MAVNPDYMRQKKISEIFRKAPDDLLLEDYKNLPEHRTIIEMHLKNRGIDIPEMSQNKLDHDKRPVDGPRSTPDDRGDNRGN